MSATNERRASKIALTKIMAAAALFAGQTTEDSDPFWGDVEASLSRMERKDREPVVRGRAD